MNAIYQPLLDQVSGTTIAAAMLFVAGLMIIPTLASSAINWIQGQVGGDGTHDLTEDDLRDWWAEDWKNEGYEDRDDYLSFEEWRAREGM